MRPPPVRRKARFPPPAAPQETVFSGASSSCLPSEPPEDAPETLGPGHFTSVQDRAEGEQDPYLELYADGTFMFMCNVYQGMTTYLGTWSYESGVLTLTRPSAEETYVFFAQDADTLLMHSGDLVRRSPAQCSHGWRSSIESGRGAKPRAKSINNKKHALKRSGMLPQNVFFLFWYFPCADCL